MLRSSILAFACAAAASPVGAQSEAALKSYFEGKDVTVQIDMPATHEGIDLHFDKATPFDAGQQAGRIRSFDVAIREGRRARVTQIKVKGDMIEFQLDGGGFNWVWQGTTKQFTPSSKSNEEEDLDKEIKKETDVKRKSRLEDKRDELKRVREKHDERRKRELDEDNRIARANDQENALRAGSRFNVRFKKHVPPSALTPEGLMDYLSRWVIFSGGRS